MGRSSFNEKETAFRTVTCSKTLQGKGQGKALNSTGECSPDSQNGDACASRQLLQPLRGPFLKIEELNLWYNFRSKNNRKHVFTGDCHADGSKLGSANGYPYDGKTLGKNESSPQPLDPGRKSWFFLPSGTPHKNVAQIQVVVSHTSLQFPTPF